MLEGQEFIKMALSNNLLSSHMCHKPPDQLRWTQLGAAASPWDQGRKQFKSVAIL